MQQLSLFEGKAIRDSNVNSGFRLLYGDSAGSPSPGIPVVQAEVECTCGVHEDCPFHDQQADNDTR